jgi:hypothetical protein
VELAEGGEARKMATRLGGEGRGGERATAAPFQRSLSASFLFSITHFLSWFHSRTIVPF